MEATADSKPTPSSHFQWWPQTRRASIVQPVLLAVEFLVCLISDEFGVTNKFYFAVYSTTQLFLLCSAVRYGYLRWAGKLSPVPGMPWWRNAGIGAVAAIVVLFLVFRPSSGESSLKAKFQSGMNADKQMLFEWVHPIGTAKSITVHDVTINNGPDGREAMVRFTIYWSSPLQKDGFTKIRGVYDFEAGRWIRGEILGTNGTTNEQMANGIAEFIGGFMSAR